MSNCVSNMVQENANKQQDWKTR